MSWNATDDYGGAAGQDRLGQDSWRHVHGTGHWRSDTPKSKAARMMGGSQPMQLLQVQAGNRTCTCLIPMQCKRLLYQSRSETKCLTPCPDAVLQGQLSHQLKACNSAFTPTSALHK